MMDVASWSRRAYLNPLGFGIHLIFGYVAVDQTIASAVLETSPLVCVLLRMLSCPRQVRYAM